MLHHCWCYHGFLAFRRSCGFPPIYFQSSGVTLPFTFSHTSSSVLPGFPSIPSSLWWDIAGLLLPSRRMWPLSSPSPNHPSNSSNFQDPRSSNPPLPSFSLHNWECLPPTANSLPTSPHLSPTPVCNGWELKGYFTVDYSIFSVTGFPTRE